MKVAIVGSRGFKSNYGGVETAVTNLAPLMAEEADVYVYGLSKNKKYSLDNEGRVFSVNMPSFIRYHFLVCFLSLFHSVLFKKVDAIYLFASGPCCLSFIAKILPVKVICCLRGMDSSRGKWNFIQRSILKFGEYSAYRFSNMLLVNSMEMYEHFSLKTTSIMYVPNGYVFPSCGDDDLIFDFGLESNSYIFFAARLDPDKRLEHLLEAYNRLEPSNIKLVVAGGQCHSDDYYNKLRSYDSENILFLGHLDQDQIDPLMRNCLIFILPSLCEGMSNSLLAAAAAQKPILCSDIAANIAVVDNKDATFKVGDVDSLTYELSKHLGNKEYMSETAFAVNKYVKETYSWETSARKFLDAIDS